MYECVNTYGIERLTYGKKNKLRDRLRQDWNKVVRRYAKYTFSELMQLIFDTYWYFEENGGQETISREDLKIIANMVRFYSLPDSPIPMKSDVFSALSDTVEGLCFEIMEGYSFTYLPHSIRVGHNYHVPAGCSSPEINMTTMDHFQTSFWEEYANRAALFDTENEEWLDMKKMIKEIADTDEDFTEEQQIFYEKYLDTTVTEEEKVLANINNEAINRIMEERIGKGKQSLEIHRTCLSLLENYRSHSRLSKKEFYEYKLLSILEML